MANERKKIFLALSRSGDEIGESAREQYRKISNLVGIKLAHANYNVIFSGNIGSMGEIAADAFMSEVGEENKNRLVTYLPRKPYEKEYNHQGWKYKPLGTTLVIDDYPEQRRERMVRNCDLMLLAGGKQGSAEYVIVSRLLSKPFIPIPQFGGIARKEYELLINKLEEQGDSDTLALFRQLGSYSLPDEEFASIIIKAIDELSGRNAGPQTIFIAMPFGKDYLDGADIEDAIKSVAKETLSWSVVLARDIEIGSNRTLTDLIPESIKQSSIVIADLHDNRPNVYYEAGIAHGQGIPTIFITKEGDDVHFDLASHERIIWKNIRDLRTKLADWLLQASKKI